MQKVLFWFGCCVACFVLSGWLCGASVLLCCFSRFNGFVVLLSCVRYSCECAKHATFPVFLAYLFRFVLLFGFGRFRVK